MNSLLNKYKIIIRLFLIISPILLASCASQPKPKEFDDTIFSKNNAFPVTLCFDLRNSTDLYSGIVLNLQPSLKPESHAIALPFSSTTASVNKDIYSAWGNYDSSTVLYYITSPGTAGNHSIGVIPIIGTASQVDIDYTNLENSVTLANSGLEYKFIYKYPDADPNRKNWLDPFAGIVNTNIDAVAVAIPPDAFGVDIGRTGKSTIPDQLFDNGDVKFFAATSTAAGVNASGVTIKAIEVKYQLPPNKAQSIFVEYFLKLIAAFIPPLLQLVTLRFYILPTDAGNKRKRKLFIITAVVIQVLIVFTFILLSLTSTISDPTKALGDLGIAFSSGIFTTYVLLQDKKASQNQASP